MSVLGKRLEKLSLSMFSTVVLEQAVSGACNLGESAQYLSNIGKLNESLAYVLCFVLFATEIAGVVMLRVPRVADDQQLSALLFAVLSCACIVEAILAASSWDFTTRTRALLLATTALKHSISLACSRRLRMYGGAVVDDSFVDTVACLLREYATRYKLAVQSCIACVCTSMHFLIYCESIFASSSLSRTIAKAQLARALSGIALFASLGSEDVRREGHKRR